MHVGGARPPRANAPPPFRALLEGVGLGPALTFSGDYAEVVTAANSVGRRFLSRHYRYGAQVFLSPPSNGAWDALNHPPFFKSLNCAAS